MNVPRDPELDELFDDPELRQTAYFLKSAPTAEPPLDPAFRMTLRRELMQQAWRVVERRQPWWRSLLAPPSLVWGGAAAAAVAVALVAALFYAPQPQPVQVGSPQNNKPDVAVVEPILVAFNQPMDHQSVEQAVTIEPATKVTYTWEGNTLRVQPVSGNLAPNTQYVVHVGPSARTADARALEKPETISFVTRTPPSPKPSPSPSPAVTPTPTPAPGVVANPVQSPLPAAPSWTAWSPDGGTIYALAGGQLLAVPTAGGRTTVLVGDGVKLAALAPDGSRIAYVRNGHVASIAADGSGQADVAATDALAIGWQQSGVVYVAGKDVFDAKKKLASLPEAATAAWFSPSGDRVLYVGATATHVFDLRGGQDAVSKAPAPVLAWAPDGKRAAWSDGQSLLAGDPATGTPVTLARLADLKIAAGTAPAASWSGGDDVLVAGGGAIWTVRADGSGLRKLSDGDYQSPAWAADSRHISFTRGSALWSGYVSGSTPPPQANPCDTSGHVLDDFMAARKRGDADAAQALLDDNGRNAYAKDSTLVWRGEGNSPALHRYYTVLQQAAGSGCRFVVRLVLNQGKPPLDVSDFDEVLTFEPDAAGRQRVHDSVAGPTRQIGKGPEVILVELLDPTHVRVSFDSDLDPSAAQAVEIDGARGRLQASGSYTDRIVTLTLAEPLATGASYHLLVPAGSLRDVGGRAPQGDYRLDFTG